jgi:dimethylargininase
MRHAVLRPPSSTYSNGLTTAGLGPPDLELALKQHERYGAALVACGIEVLYLDPDPDHPDSCFVEDPAIVTERGFMLMRPGASSRRTEVPSMAKALAPFQPQLPAIESPGTVDGGDVCQAGDHFWIGLTKRTNLEGARQLGRWLESVGFTHETVPMEGLDLLHLKSGMGYLGDGRVAIVDELSKHAAFQNYERVRVPPEERYAANCVRINDRVLIASGHPEFESSLRSLGYDVVALDMSEFEKMDGGISCLSLRW